MDDTNRSRDLLLTGVIIKLPFILVDKPPAVTSKSNQGLSRIILTRGQLSGEGSSMLILFPSVSTNGTYFPTPCISIGSPSTVPPNCRTFSIDA